jgi:DNA-binding CsgD family transcriptional regulator
MTHKEERLKHQKQLSATEKLIKIQQLKAEGKKQREVCQILNISRRTVCQYWNSTETMSKQEANKKSKPVKRRWKPRLNGQSGYNREKLYGITPELYEQMFIKQDGKCGICGVLQAECDTAFNVDHNHTTSKVRGLLCSKCNLALGLMNDNVDVLANAIKYLTVSR